MLPDNGSTKWRLAAGSGNRTVVSFFKKRWVKWRTLKGDAELAAAGQPITLVLPSGKVAYRGSTRVTRPEAGQAHEAGDGQPTPARQLPQGRRPPRDLTSWSPAALESQAIAARTYAALRSVRNRTRTSTRPVTPPPARSTAASPRSTPRPTTPSRPPPARCGSTQRASRRSRSSPPATVGNGGRLAALPRREEGPVRGVVGQLEQGLDVVALRRQRREELSRDRHPHLGRGRHPRRQRGAGGRALRVTLTGTDGTVAHDRRGVPVPRRAEVELVHPAGLRLRSFTGSGRSTSGAGAPRSRAWHRTGCRSGPSARWPG